MLSRGASPFLAALRRVTGVDLLSDLTTFFGLLGDMTEDFSERAAQVEQLLRAPTTAFVLVTSAQPTAIDEAIWFRRTLARGRPALRRRDRQPRPSRPARRRRPDERAGRAGRRRSATTWPAGSPRTSPTTTCSPAATRAGSQRLAHSASATTDPLILVPHLDDDVHDIEGLLRVHRFLFAAAAEREAMIAEAVS